MPLQWIYICRKQYVTFYVLRRKECIIGLLCSLPYCSEESIDAAYFSQILRVLWKIYLSFCPANKNTFSVLYYWRALISLLIERNETKSNNMHCFSELRKQRWQKVAVISFLGQNLQKNCHVWSLTCIYLIPVGVSIFSSNAKPWTSISYVFDSNRGSPSYRLENRTFYSTNSGVSRVWQAWHEPSAQLWRGRKNCLGKIKIYIFTVSWTFVLRPIQP